MKAILIAFAILFASTVSAEYRDCNLSENTAVCKAEFEAKEVARAAEQNKYVGNKLNVFICESLTSGTCTGGAGGVGGGGA